MEACIAYTVQVPNKEYRWSLTNVEGICYQKTQKGAYSAHGPEPGVANAHWIGSSWAGVICYGQSISSFCHDVLLASYQIWSILCSAIVEAENLLHSWKIKQSIWYEGEEWNLTTEITIKLQCMVIGSVNVQILTCEKSCLLIQDIPSSPCSVMHYINIWS